MHLSTSGEQFDFLTAYKNLHSTPDKRREVVAVRIHTYCKALCVRVCPLKKTAKHCRNAYCLELGMWWEAHAHTHKTHNRQTEH